MVRGEEPVVSWPFIRQGQIKTVTVTPDILSDDGDVVRRWAIAGCGIVQKSILDVSDDLASGRLKALLEDWEAPGTPLNLIIAPKRIQSRRVRAFIDHAVAYFGMMKEQSVQSAAP